MTRLPALDGARAIAILLVLAGHFGTGLIPYPVAWGVGVAGVYLFFVLSGFLISGLLLAELDRSGTISLRRFYWRRACRILPAYLLWLGVTWLASTGIREPRDGEILTALLTYTENYRQVFDASPLIGHSFRTLTNHAWSLAVEEQFYLLWPLALLALPVRFRARALVAAVGAMMCWRALAIILFGFPLRYANHTFETGGEMLALGCLLAVLWHSHRASLERVGRVGVPALIAGILVVPLSYTVAGRLLLTPLAGWCLTVFLLATLSRRVAWLEMRWLGWLGAISYPLYLWHVWGLHLGRMLDASPLTQRLVALGLGLAFACLSYYGVERPILRWRDRPQAVAVPA